MRRRRRRARGFTLVEVIVSMAVFGVVIAILAIMTAEMRAHQKRMPMNFMKHPQISAVLSRMRRDVQDAFSAQPYLKEHDGYTMNERVLIIRSMQPTGGVQTVVWDFREPGIVRRKAYNVGVATEWVARGVPTGFNVTIDAVKVEDRPWGVRLIAVDEEKRVAIDQIFQPRAH